ncbi:CBS domain-containing protein [Aliiruegeria lutimaris]|uniref:CBS domain-containing protein n=1 Tax=Aliiruegeria lutimaris TaxID=571298 RepID=A0A1G8M2P9_9RHOB|nr:CBS domain-containing protein [Aliiruegeria lutimaris]SDI62229.1 CBS domain-containing protein [Aliiruegeria lutimaris]
MSVQRIGNYESGIRACCSAKMPVLRAAEKLVDLDVNALAVVDIHGGVEGILTDHDIIRAMVKRGPDLSDETVRFCMSRPAITCEADTRLSAALKLMSRNHIRHLAMLRDGAFVRMITLKDLLECIHQDDTLEVDTLRDLAAGRLTPLD